MDKTSYVENTVSGMKIFCCEDNRAGKIKIAGHGGAGHCRVDLDANTHGRGESPAWHAVGVQEIATEQLSRGVAGREG